MFVLRLLVLHTGGCRSYGPLSWRVRVIRSVVRAIAKKVNWPVVGFTLYDTVRVRVLEDTGIGCVVDGVHCNVVVLLADSKHCSTRSAWTLAELRLVPAAGCVCQKATTYAGDATIGVPPFMP